MTDPAGAVESLTIDPGDSLERARALLERVRRALGAPGAAIYFRREELPVLVASAGEGEFAPVPPEPLDGFSRVQVRGGGEIFFGPGGRAPSEAGEELLGQLASAVHGWALEKSLAQKRFEVNYRGVELEALYDVGLAIASTLNLDELSEEILLRAVALLDARRGALWGAERDRYVLARVVGGDAVRRLSIGEIGRSGEVANDLLPGAEHLLAVPIEVDGEPKGLLAVGDKESRTGVGPFSPEDRRTLRLLANQAAIALENAHLHRQALEKERLEREAELAAEIQRRLLPSTLPVVDGLELAGWNRPARQVGGDWYDLLPLANRQLAAVVADVSGKGMPAALMVSTLYSALRLLVEGSAVADGLFERLNRHIFESSAPNKFITLLAADIDPTSGRVRYVNAGHNPAIHLGREGGVQELPAGGMPLGLFAGGSFASGELELERGDLLCFFSDGITEAASPADEEFGDGRLIDLLRKHRERPLGEIIQAVDRATTGFASGMPQGDDQTLVLVRKG